MKKIIVFVFLSLLFMQSCFAIEKSKINRPTWQSVAPVKYQNVTYKEPIQRPKWIKPLAWFGWVGTCFIVPFPIIIDEKDSGIARNNMWVSFKEQFEKDIDECENIYEKDKEIHQCYQRVQNRHIQYFNMQLGNYYNAQQIQAIERLRYSQ